MVLLKPFDIDYFLTRISLIFNDFKLIKQGKRGIDLALIELLLYLKNDVNTDDYLILILLVKAFNLIFWRKIKLIIGYKQLRMMFDCTKSELKHKYSFIYNVLISEEGLQIKNMETAINKNNINELVNSLMSFIYHFLNIVVLLSGKIDVDMAILKKYEIE